MTVSLIGWGRFFDKFGNKVTVPAPSTDPGKPWLWDLLAAEAQNLASVGFDRIQLPPASKAQGGDGAGCDGYGIYDPRDLGTKNQQGSIPTRYGTADSLRRLVAVAHRCGLAVDLDLVGLREHVHIALEVGQQDVLAELLQRNPGIAREPV